jgi:hypothetical protein
MACSGTAIIIIIIIIIIKLSRFSCVAVPVLAAGPKHRGRKAGRVDGLLMAIKIRSTFFFGWELKPEAPCPHILRHIKNSLMYLRY